MSLVRAGRPSQLIKAKKPVRPKKATAPKREWVSTVSDLSVYKPTPAELSHRHEIHKSHNKAAAQWELKEKALKRRLKHTGGPVSLDETSLSIIREVFSDQLLLRDVLTRSDRALAVVKDLFGDVPQRHTGHPSVTMAPDFDSDSVLPVLQKPDPPTHLSLLSQSMMDPEALNELEVSKDEPRDYDTHPARSSDSHVIRRTNVRKIKAQSQGRVMQQQKVRRPSCHPDDRDNVPVTPCTTGRAPDQTALNATVAVQRVQSKQNQSEDGEEETSVLVSQVLNPERPLSRSGRMSSRTSRIRTSVCHSLELNGSTVASLSGDQSSLGLLQDMLGQVEADLDTLCPDTLSASAQSPKQLGRQGLTGFSVAMVSTLGRLVHLLKQREVDAQKGAEERRRLEVEVKEQRGLIDALTTETMTLREEIAALQTELQQRTAELEQRLASVVMVMGELGLLGESTGPPQDPHATVAVCQSAPVAKRPPKQTQVCGSSAILLSPPQQRDNSQQSPVTHPVLLQHQLPPVDIFPSREVCSPSSLNSLPLSRLPSTSSLSLTSEPRHSQLSPNAMLAEITQLSRQNDLIRAQLRQAKGLGSAAGRSPNSGDEQRRSSPVIAERVTSQSIGERTVSSSSNTSRGSQHLQPHKEEPSTQQGASSNTPSVNSLEQRLLELNRQSAAARGRLLELIEQQKQVVAVSVSPSVSPIPPSALSPNTEAGGGRSGETLLLPERELGSNGGRERRSADSDLSSHRFSFETRDGKLQVDKQKEQGWFSLAAHLR